MRFAVISFGPDGTLLDDRDLLGRLVERLGQTADPITDVFVLSHGWLNDLARASATYDNWFWAGRQLFQVAGAETTIRRPGFRPLVVGIHWPSAPWEDPGQLRSVEQRIAFHQDVLGTEEATDDLGWILRQAERNPDQATLSEADEARFLRIDALAGNRDDLVGAPTGDDRGSFDPGRIIRSHRSSPARALIGSRPMVSLLSPLWVTSFWRMKRRARTVGATGVHRVLRLLQQATGGRDVRFHLIGHSFGAIVCASALQGCAEGADGDPLAPVHSLILLQGALSLWSFAGTIPDVSGSGHFHPIIARSLVSGPIVTTQSIHDLALRWFYQVAATATRSVHLMPQPRRVFPPYGAIGCHGLAGLPERTVSLHVAKAQLHYPITAGRCYNVDGSAVLENSGLSLQGAHSNLTHAELASLVWAAALSDPR